MPWSWNASHMSWPRLRDATPATMPRGRAGLISGPRMLKTCSFGVGAGCGLGGGKGGWEGEKGGAGWEGEKGGLARRWCGR